MTERKKGQSPEHISQVVAPSLVGFTLPTVALVATQQKELAWSEASLSCFLVSSGLLLAAFQLSIGKFQKDAPVPKSFLHIPIPAKVSSILKVSSLRFGLSSCGILAMRAGLSFIVLPRAGLAEVSWRALAFLVLLAGAAAPLIARIILSARDARVAPASAAPGARQ